MPWVGTSSAGQFACATASQRTLKDLRIKRKGQPVFVLGHVLSRKAQEATFEAFNDRLAVVRFSDEALVGYEPRELLLPTEIDEQAVPYFEIRSCRSCELLFPLTIEELESDPEPEQCPDCTSSSTEHTG
ncbi:conserved hypothetical protein [Candidatus Nitrospira nitrosa]|uniref:Uncharacterized protein n=2 Tax=Candidatus Nitrospira nitrosa TaxID=1742972 RepID=A0A0S4LIX5_9BACT|nr:conserved hypothetical protein [Candidatus Nitrospira nitrosa]